MTNVLVSGLYNPGGPPGRIVDLALGGTIRLLYADRILAEYQDVLARPELAIDPSLAQAIVGYFRLAGERVVALPLPSAGLPDPGDIPFAEVALTGAAEAFVTGNLEHFAKLKQLGLVILSPAQCLDLFR